MSSKLHADIFIALEHIISCPLFDKQYHCRLAPQRQLIGLYNENEYMKKYVPNMKNSFHHLLEDLLLRKNFLWKLRQEDNHPVCIRI